MWALPQAPFFSPKKALLIPQDSSGSHLGDLSETSGRPLGRLGRLSQPRQAWNQKVYFFIDFYSIWARDPLFRVDETNVGVRNHCKTQQLSESAQVEIARYTGSRLPKNTTARNPTVKHCLGNYTILYYIILYYIILYYIIIYYSILYYIILYYIL